MTDAQVEEFFATLRAANPQPVTELEFSSVFELLAAVLLSAQATDASVNRATRRLFAVAGTPQRLLRAGRGRDSSPSSAASALYRTKARNLIATCALLLEQPCRGSAPRWSMPCRPCPASAARPRTSCSTWPSANRPFPSTPMCFALPTAPAWPAEARQRQVEVGLQRRVPAHYAGPCAPLARSCTGAMSAWRASHCALQCSVRHCCDMGRSVPN